MAFSHGKGGSLVLNSGAMTAYISEVNLARSRDTSETSTLGTTAKTYVPGLVDGTQSGTGFYDKTASTGPVAILEAIWAGGVAVTCQYRPAVGPGEYNYAYSAILTEYEITNSLGDAVGISFSLQVTGAVTVSTQ